MGGAEERILAADCIRLLALRERPVGVSSESRLLIASLVPGRKDLKSEAWL